ncbi:hypothetical protein BWK69_01205 [Candidatus Parcubacteria bacterium A4]|nr:MAG: hypothetical protein BWK69_01205 [Candidatus Parcubacteria bacterium A4]
MKHLVILDSNSIIHRAYHALPPLRTKEGDLVNAVYGFLLVFLKVIKELRPDYLVATFDLPGKTFRHDAFKDYKAKRPSTPEGLSPQFLPVKNFLRAFDVKIFEKSGFEADDAIGTIVEKNKNGNIEITIISGDMDILQLVNDRVKVYFLRRGVKDTTIYGSKDVEEKYGITPEQIPFFKGLKGDTSDNIPGIKGVGEKTAIKLIKDFESMENLYRELEREDGCTKKVSPNLRELILKSKSMAFLSKKLGELDRDVPIEFNLDECSFGDYDKKIVREMFERFDFFSLINKFFENMEKEKNILKENLKLW